MAGATARLRREGILVKGEFGLLAAAEASRVVIDKTGTLTQTELVIDTAFLNRGVSQEEAISLAAAMQQASSHPAAKAFHHLSTHHSVERVQVIPGAGIEGWCPVAGQKLRLGSEAFCRELAPDLPPPPDASHYWIALVNESHWVAWLGLAEHLRTGAHATITQLQTLGLAVEILSGDSPARVQAIAQQLRVPLDDALQAESKTASTEQVPVSAAVEQGQDNTPQIQTPLLNSATHARPQSPLGWRGALSPSDKLAVLQQYQQQNETVLAVGDGLNDAPLLSAADASVAVAGATALARAQADFVVLEDDLTRIPVLIRGARAARRIMRQNLWWAASYNLIGIPFAALGYVPPWVAAIGMSLSSLLVVLNALRLRRDSSLADTSGRLNIS
jgi:Cu2+-exporting ATPase